MITDVGWRLVDDVWMSQLKPWLKNPCWWVTPYSPLTCCDMVICTKSDVIVCLVHQDACLHRTMLYQWSLTYFWFCICQHLNIVCQFWPVYSLLYPYLIIRVCIYLINRVQLWIIELVEHVLGLSLEKGNIVMMKYHMKEKVITLDDSVQLDIKMNLQFWFWCSPGVTSRWISISIFVFQNVIPKSIQS